MINFLFLAAQAFAEDPHHAAVAAHGAHDAGHHAVHVPWSSLLVQGFNFLFLMAVLVYLLRKTVKAHFAHRASEYTELVERAERARKEAESAKREVEAKLARLEDGAKNTVQQAETEAAALKTRMVAEANAAAQKLEADTRLAVAGELEKAKAELRRDLLTRALEGSKESLSKNLGSSEQKKLQAEFVEKIQVVGG